MTPQVCRGQVAAHRLQMGGSGGAAWETTLIKHTQQLGEKARETCLLELAALNGEEQPQAQEQEPLEAIKSKVQ